MSLTIISTLKAQGNPITEAQQLNALKSWRAIDPAIEIIYVGNVDGTRAFCDAQGVTRIGNVRSHPDYGLEYFSDILRLGDMHATHDRVMYVNSDIILPPNTLDLATSIDAVRFLGIGKRWNHPTPPMTIDTNNPRWWTAYQSEALRLGIHHPPTGIDYYLFPKGGLPELPDVVVGRWFVDNATLGAFKREGIPLLDCTDALFAIHQNHPATYDGHDDASGYNQSLLHEGIVYTVDDCDYKLMLA